MELREALLCIVRWQEIISPSYYPLLELREAQLEPYGTAFGLLEQSLWLYLERPQGYWNGPPGPWNCAKNSLFCIFFLIYFAIPKKSCIFAPDYSQKCNENVKCFVCVIV